MRKPFRLTWLSDGPTLATGFGTVGRHVLGRLVRERGHDVRCLAWYYQGEPYDAEAFPYRITPERHPGSADGNLPRLLTGGGKHVVITLGDPWNFDWVPDVLDRTDFTWIAYLTVCSSPLPPSAVEYLRRADAVICASRFGADVLAAALPEVVAEVIPFGVDATVFRPLPTREDLRAENGLNDRFVVGFVGRNQPRKQLPVLIKAFAKFHPRHPDAFLYLHTDVNDMGWDVPGLLDRYGLGDASGITADYSVENGLSDERMNEVYNMLDVFVLPSMGEGFGLPLLEAMACGVPVATTDYSSNRDLISGRGELIGIETFLTGTRLNFELPLPDADDLAQKLALLHGDTDRRQAHRDKGLEFAREMTWDRCAEALDGVIQRAVAATTGWPADEGLARSSRS